ncbi:MAG: metal ABC transporter substrate-binding protein [Hyphomicrobiales bacterium]|nr:metal ABC transporter substrate-binding protein [Hyphomicrobiales bacterium]
MAGPTRRTLVLAALAAVAGVAFAPTGPARAAEPLPVVATFSILADLVARVGGERVTVATLVGPGGDAHVFQPKPADAEKLVRAKLVFVNGLGFEGWMDRLVKSSGTRATIVVASQGVTPLKADDEPGHDHGHDHGHEGLDPHAWQSIADVKIYVANIRDGLAAADPTGVEVYRANAAAFLAELDALETEVTAAIAKIPPEKRRVITSHDAFGYFAAAYGVEFLAPQGMSTDAEPSAKDVARLIRQIRKEKIRAVFVETMTDPRMVKRIAEETGVRLGGAIFSDSLSPKGGPASTYVDMVRHNVRLLGAAMGDS